MEQSSLVKGTKNAARISRSSTKPVRHRQDGANLTAQNVDWKNGVLVYRRKKLGAFSKPARLTIGSKLRTLLASLPTFRRFVSAYRAKFRRPLITNAK